MSDSIDKPRESGDEGEPVLEFLEEDPEADLVAVETKKNIGLAVPPDVSTNTENQQKTVLLETFIAVLKENAQDLSINPDDVKPETSLADCSFDSLNRLTIIGDLDKKLLRGKSLPEDIAGAVADVISDGQFYSWTVQETAARIGEVVKIYV